VLADVADGLGKARFSQVSRRLLAYHCLAAVFALVGQRFTFYALHAGEVSGAPSSTPQHHAAVYYRIYGVVLARRKAEHVGNGNRLDYVLVAGIA
jgi:hypothetical protein